MGRFRAYCAEEARAESVLAEGESAASAVSVDWTAVSIVAAASGVGFFGSGAGLVGAATAGGAWDTWGT